MIYFNTFLKLSTVFITNLLVFSNFWWGISSFANSATTLTVTKELIAPIASIAAVVNNDIITQKDLEDRLKLLLFFMRMPDTPENRQEVLPDVMKTLQEERLQLNEIRNAKLKIEPDHIQEAYELFEQQNGIPKGTLASVLKQEGLSLKTLEDQATAQLGWVQLIRSSFQDQLRITDSEVEEALQESLSHVSDTYYLISEIFLQANADVPELELEKHAQQIFTQLTQGAPFPMMAHHFSQSASAATYGDIGWIRQDQMNAEWAEIIEKVPLGSITLPIRTSSGYHIIAVRDIRKNVSSNDNQQFISFKQVRFPISSKGIGQENESMQKLQRRVQGCRNLSEIAPLIPGCKVRDIESIPAQNIPHAIQELIKDLPEGQLSAAHIDNNNLLAYMVCHSENRTSEDVLKDHIRQRLEGEKLNRISHQMLEGLKQNLINNHGS